MLLRRPLLLHLPLFLWYLFTLHRDVLLSSGGRLLGAATYGGRWKYLTFINMILQTTYFGVCVLTDLVWLLPQHGKRVQRLCLRISALQDWLFAALAFPIGFFVVVSFWLLYAFDRELVYPKILDQIIPTWMNHAMHSVVLLLLMLELILVPHRWPSHKGGMAVLISFCCSYLLWVFWIRHRSAIWVYPIMEVLSPVGMGIFLIAAVLVTIALYAVGVKLHHWRWGHRDQCGSESFCVNQEQVLKLQVRRKPANTGKGKKEDSHEDSFHRAQHSFDELLFARERGPHHSKPLAC
ncbi:androgen-induced gene 1 protein-like isoform X1 [Scyliorhinus torazame]|uniref:androgen-induced gene 1 protein-like isoform X1 n=1 Tax=Scyliorhinus torazame TaxID=75743 RepID=UPI003B5A80F5